MKYLIVSAALLVLTGCATDRDTAGTSRTGHGKLAWTLEDSREAMVVAVSPARQSLQMAGSVGLVLGSGVSAMVDSKYRGRVHDALGNYDAGSIIKKDLQAAFKRNFPAGANCLESGKSISAPGDANDLYLDGYDHRLALEIDYGLYGPTADLIIKMEARLSSLPREDTPQKETVICVAGPLLASDSVRNPTKLFKPRVKTAALSVDEASIANWTRNSGSGLKSAFESLSPQAAAALLTALGIEDTALGNYTLVRKHFFQKEFEECERLLGHVIDLDPGFYDAQNELAVVKFQQEKTSEALMILEKLTVDHPDYGPAWYNLAWILVESEGDPAKAKDAYQRALQTGMPTHKKLNELLEK